ncbi:hypothetical protein KAFR_0L01530 [Kazachstania africana CBS 2517]|uniref:Glycylpeptide N-tetradecanoyltransferase n=1 Tax=Kazachstania africana (strain ATCC 22294 / BCRC 22015 / CBS 2517 / CECT 1963 / NBRC 1671 / NRRL Y-8276) TaxID=1071382 RepID=H2B2B3_KAZAF|nr:hypothetical protein KAFR_0L01530 [Kazachstania africana CBS 2517]CCF60763.1 hypothetical protein KAFR_0L01530 [Kazachstania africana CBS 2517]
MSEEKKDSNVDKIQDLLKLLALNNGDVQKLNSQQRKAFEEYKFWRTQQVVSFDEKFDKEGVIDDTKTPADIPDKPLPLIDGFTWCNINPDDPNELDDLFVLLNENYVEDKHSVFRFNYKEAFLNWALKAPGWKIEWNVGVRVQSTGKLVAFISAIPLTLRIRDNAIPSVEVNFLCIHKQLRSKRLAPLMIMEIQRRVNRYDIWQALYTAGVVLPSPISTCRYTHRALNWTKLYETGFTDLPGDRTAPQMVAECAIPKVTKMQGLRPMKKEDVPEAFALLSKYQERFDLAHLFDEEEFKHWFLGSQDDNKVIFSYVVEQPDGKITDFFSFYSLPFSILGNAKHDQVEIAYLYYYATDADFEYNDRFSKEATEVSKQRLTELVGDALILAKNMGMDVFNALTSQENTLFLENLKFGLGDGLLNFYTLNYKAFPITGGLKPDNTIDAEKRSNVGVVML